MEPIKYASLVLPTTLAVAALLVGGSCDDEEPETEPETEELTACVDIDQTSECVPCRTESGDKDCAGADGCYWDPDEDMCGAGSDSGTA